MKRPFLLVLACLTLLAAGCGDDSEKAAATPTPELATTKPEIVVPKGALPKELVTEDVKVGTGATATKGKKIRVHYVGVSMLNGRQFDSSWDTGEPFELTLGDGEVIPGWDQGIEGMKVGGRRQLVIPPDLAYGEQGQAPIGPNETLFFVVDLLAVE